MEVKITVPYKTDMKLIEARFGDDIYIDFEDEEEGQKDYFYGRCAEAYEEGEEESETFDDCVSFCGFCDAVIPESMCLIEGNGGWAQGMIGRKDFKEFCCTPQELFEYRRVSALYWAAHAKGLLVKSKELNNQKG